MRETMTRPPLSSGICWFWELNLGSQSFRPGCLLHKHYTTCLTHSYLRFLFLCPCQPLPTQVKIHSTSDIPLSSASGARVHRARSPVIQGGCREPQGASRCTQFLCVGPQVCVTALPSLVRARQVQKPVRIGQSREVKWDISFVASILAMQVVP